jgi:transposase
MEPTRNAWVPLAAWLRRRGATVVMVPPEQSADLRDYYSKHVKSDRLDSRLLARLPLLHPDGLRPAEGLGPADPLRRAVALRGSLVKRRSVIAARLDSYLELLGPAWHAAFGGDLTLLTVLRFLAAGYADPHAVRRLGRARLARLIWRWSHGAWGEDHAGRILAAAAETLQLWDTELSYPDLAEDIAAEARLALALCTEIRDLDTKIAALLRHLDPAGIMTSVPGAGAGQRSPDPGAPRRPGPVPVPGRRPLVQRPGPRPVSLRDQRPPRAADQGRGRLAARGPVPGRRPCPPRRPDPGRPLLPAHGAPGQAPQLRALPHRPGLLSKIIACWRAGVPYQVRDTDGTVLTAAQGRTVIAQRYQVSAELRARRRTSHAKTGDEPTTPGVARRSDTSPPPHHATTTSRTT